MLYPTVVKESEAHETQKANDNNLKKGTNVLRTPRRTFEATQVPHEQGAEESFHQKSVARDAPRSELLTPVVGTVETRSGPQRLVRQMGRIHVLEEVGTDNRRDGMS